MDVYFLVEATLHLLTALTGSLLLLSYQSLPSALLYICPDVWTPLHSFTSACFQAPADTYKENGWVHVSGDRQVSVCVKVLLLGFNE